jgi:hypothetical protein
VPLAEIKRDTMSQHLYRCAGKISPKRRRGLAFQPQM